MIKMKLTPNSNTIMVTVGVLNIGSSIEGGSRSLNTTIGSSERNINLIRRTPNLVL